VPDRNEEYLLYQTLVGTWPITVGDESSYENFKERMKNYMLKAIREAKVNTSWINPNAIYEDALLIFVERIMDNGQDNQFLKDFVNFQKVIANYGMYNSLSQVLLKITCPGVPDFYQGTEIWNLSLVDPDNRRPVDYALRNRMLEDLKKREFEISQREFSRELIANRTDGMIKLYLIYKTLNYRRKNRELFERGEYLPLEVMGERADNVCAFARRIGTQRVIVSVPRYFTKLIPQAEDLPLGKQVWGDSYIVVPISEPGARYQNIFTGETLTARTFKEATALQLSDVFFSFPVSVLERIL